jgi:hypothetical protein
VNAYDPVIDITVNRYKDKLLTMFWHITPLRVEDYKYLEQNIKLDLREMANLVLEAGRKDEPRS